METYELETLQQVIEKKIAGDSCGMCRPYISNMLKTGEFEFAPGDVDPDYHD